MTSMPIPSARVRTTSMVCGSASASTTNGPVLLRCARRTSVIASAAAVPSSSSEALAVGQAGQVGHDGLEVEQRLEAALRDLRLVRRVGGVPGGVLEHVAPDHRRRDGGVVAEPDHGLRRTVLRGEGAQRAGRRLLVERVREVERRGRADAVGHRGRHQRLERLVSDRLEHVGDGGVVRADVPGDELAEPFDGAGGGGRGEVGHAGSLRSRRWTSPSVGPVTSRVPTQRGPGA